MTGPHSQDPSNGELFASTVYATPWTQVEPVLDSSRYFVLRVEGDAGQRAYIGMGFQERGEAFDFQVSSWFGDASLLSFLALALSRTLSDHTGNAE